MKTVAKGLLSQKVALFELMFNDVLERNLTKTWSFEFDQNGLEQVVCPRHD